MLYSSKLAKVSGSLRPDSASHEHCELGQQILILKYEQVIIVLRWLTPTDVMKNKWDQNCKILPWAWLSL